jgi:hypothetical protein
MVKFDVIIFSDNDVEIEIKVSSQEETVWLSQKQISELLIKKGLSFRDTFRMCLERENWMNRLLCIFCTEVMLIDRKCNTTLTSSFRFAIGFTPIKGWH